MMTVCIRLRSEWGYVIGLSHEVQAGRNVGELEGGLFGFKFRNGRMSGLGVLLMLGETFEVSAASGFVVASSSHPFRNAVWLAWYGHAAKNGTVL